MSNPALNAVAASGANALNTAESPALRSQPPQPVYEASTRTSIVLRNALKAPALANSVGSLVVTPPQPASKGSAIQHAAHETTRGIDWSV